jgi:sigma-B regulation protein RsbQ
MNRNILTRNNVNRFGKGNQPMMFAHGYGCDQNMWRFITPAFEEDYQIILFDHTGSGQSDESEYDFDKYNSLDGYADDIIQICDELELEDVIFVGHSVSSMIGVLAVAERPELFSKLVLIGPSPRYINDDDYHGGFSKQDIDGLIETLESNYLGWSSSITPIIAGNPDKPETAEELHNSFCRMNPEIAKHFAKVTFLGDNREDLSRVTVPSLIIQCDPDMIAPVEVGRYVQEKMQNSCLMQINASGHCPHLTAPDLTIETMKSYIESDH